ncbi:hypothetical protein Maq22A_c16905 [Methylobacterium aquaticum]|uniref:Uncharacterized protein n=1 Tax=Methylobacterium aquaticum TaxID=270351 RepID=A0A0C6FHH8_9HYPH|nr:hypothetical protein Maq22A_c16905 [Methylobacterium aquaticum]
MPLTHWAMTSSGPETMNIGEAITGRARAWRRLSGRDIGGVAPGELVGEVSLGSGIAPGPGRGQREA